MREQTLTAGHAIVSGKVQGVCFRVTAKAVADRLAVNGWIKNLPNGTVECLAVGHDTQVKKFVSWLAQGPSAATVKGVKKRYIAATGQFTDFVIVYD